MIERIHFRADQIYMLQALGILIDRAMDLLQRDWLVVYEWVCTYIPTELDPGIREKLWKTAYINSDLSRALIVDRAFLVGMLDGTRPIFEWLQVSVPRHEVYCLDPTFSWPGANGFSVLWSNPPVLQDPQSDIEFTVFDCAEALVTYRSSALPYWDPSSALRKTKVKRGEYSTIEW
jgi:hypothetical protein